MTGAKVKETIQDIFKKDSTLNMSLGIDGWTSPNGFSYLGVSAVWINDDWKFVRLLIGMEELIGSHTGANMGETLVSILKEYDIGLDRVTSMVCDNAANNNTMVDYLLKKDPDFKDKRMRCFLHVLNLGAKAFLLQFDPIEKKEKKSTESNSAELDSIDENNLSDSTDCEDEGNNVDAVEVEEDEEFDAVEDDQEDMVYTLEQLNSFNVERQLHVCYK